MVSEILITKLKSSVGLSGIIFLENGFRFESKILNCDDEFVEIYDIKKSSNKFIRLSQIAEVDGFENGA